MLYTVYIHYCIIYSLTNATAAALQENGFTSKDKDLLSSIQKVEVSGSMLKITGRNRYVYVCGEWIF